MVDSPMSRSRRQRGFSLIVVFLLILVMVGISSAVMLSTQGDLQVSGHDREAAVARYAAEAGVSWAEWWLYRYPVTLSGNLLACGAPEPIGAWNSLLSSVSPAVTSAFCVNGPAGAGNWPPTSAPVAVAAAYTPGQPPPAPGTPVQFDAARSGTYQWCIHNNALDPLFALFGQVPPPPAPAAGSDCFGGPNSHDSDGIITIESWGYGPNGASAHLSVDVNYFNPVTNRCQSYGQGGGDERKGGGCNEINPPPKAVAKIKGI